MNTSTKNRSTSIFSSIKTFFLLAILSLSYITSSAQSEELKTVTVTIENINNTRGKMLVGLHTSDTFMKAEATQNEAAKIEGNTLTITFKDVKPGAYAIMVLHDENNNQKMDFAADGMPIESYGMSNNPTLMGPPAFSDAEFKVTKDNVALKISL